MLLDMAQLLSPISIPAAVVVVLGSVRRVGVVSKDGEFEGLLLLVGGVLERRSILEFRRLFLDLEPVQGV